MISIKDFEKVGIRAGKILSVEEIEGSDKLLKLKVDFGPTSAEGYGETKQVVSGIKKYFEDPQSLVGIACAFVTNLEPRMIMGLESQAMIMALAADDGTFSLLKVSDDIPPGTKVN